MYDLSPNINVLLHGLSAMAVDKIWIGPDRNGSDQTDKSWIGSDRTHKTWIGSNSIKETHIHSLKVDAFQIPIKDDEERSRK